MQRNRSVPDGPRPSVDAAQGRSEGGGRAGDALDPRDADEALARETRSRLRAQGIVAVDPDCRIAELLEPAELLVTVRRSIYVDRRQLSTAEAGLEGDLYVTTRRLVHLGRRTITCGLDEIRDVVLGPDRLLLVLDGGRGVSLVVDDPQHLRVEIAAARAAARTAGRDPCVRLLPGDGDEVT